MGNVPLGPFVLPISQIIFGCPANCAIDAFIGATSTPQWHAYSARHPCPLIWRWHHWLAEVDCDVRFLGRCHRVHGAGVATVEGEHHLCPCRRVLTNRVLVSGRGEHVTTPELWYEGISRHSRHVHCC